MNICIYIFETNLKYYIYSHSQDITKVKIYFYFYEKSVQVISRTVQLEERKMLKVFGTLSRYQMPGVIGLLTII